MNKKILTVFVMLTVIFSVFAVPAVYAAKSNAQKLIEDKTADLFLATVSDVNNDYITCEVFDTVKRPNNTSDKNSVQDSGISNSTINIKKFKYSYCEEHADSYNTPKIGDNIFISAQSDGNTYKLSGCAYKVDTVDVKTLNFLVPAPMKGQSCLYDITAIAYFVAANGMPMEFKFEESTISIKHNDELVQIYPQADGETPLKFIDAAGKVVSGAVEAKDVINYDGIAPQSGTNLVLTQINTTNNAWILSLFIIAGGVVVGLVLAVIMRSRKFKKKRKGI